MWIPAVVLVLPARKWQLIRNDRFDPRARWAATVTAHRGGEAKTEKLNWPTRGDVIVAKRLRSLPKTISAS
jgi:hypothetical protein